MKERTMQRFELLRRLVDEAKEHSDRLYLGRVIIDADQMFELSLDYGQIADPLSDEEWRLVAGLVRAEMHGWLEVIKSGMPAGNFEYLQQACDDEYLAPWINAGVTEAGEDDELMRQAVTYAHDYLVIKATAALDELRSQFSLERWEALDWLISFDRFNASGRVRPEEINLPPDEWKCFHRQARTVWSHRLAGMKAGSKNEAD